VSGLDERDGPTSGRQALLLDAALESIPYGFCVWSDAFELVLWNRHYREIYGFAASQIRQGMSLAEVVALSASRGNHPDFTPEQFLAQYTSALKANRFGARTRAQERLSGGRIVETANVYTPGLGWVVTHEDVTEEIARAELVQRRKRELEVQNMRLDAAVNNIGQGLAMFDAGERLVICNRAYSQLYGLPEALTQPGVTLGNILDWLVKSGLLIADATSDYRAWHRTMLAKRQHSTVIQDYRGRVIVMQHQPTADGGWVSTHEDVTERRQSEERIRHLARHDVLTDLPNHMAFREELERAEPALERGQQAAVLWVDIEQFRSVNDSHGHLVGDEVLKAAAARLMRGLRGTDILARVGGDEFALLLRPLDSPRDAAGVARRMIKRLSEPFEIADRQIELQAEIGIALAPGDGRSADALMKNAELALRRAKDEGRNSYHFFEVGMDAALRRRRSLEQGLRQALSRNALRLVYQPLVNLKTRAINGFEALLRWEDAERGPVSPAEFIPVAEDTGAILPIGEWVLREACKTASEWPEGTRVAVNLSAAQIYARGIIATVRSALEEADLSPDRLELEITESVLLIDSEQVLSTLHGLKALGVRISMDDFGTGYSSLSYLRSFPFDKIKIDRSFTMDFDKRAGGQAIIKAIIGLGHTLGMTTTAEGVETRDQLEAMQMQGCDEVQGFLFSPPVAPEKIPELFSRPLLPPLRVANSA